MNKFIKDMDAKKYRKAKGKNPIHINPAHKGLFTEKAKSHNEGVQEFASQVLANKDNYSPSTVKQANFAHVAKSWSK